IPVESEAERLESEAACLSGCVCESATQQTGAFAMRTEGISPLRRRMIEDMTFRNLSPTTRAVYIHNVKKFSQYFVDPRIVSTSSTSVPTKFIWCRRALLGRR